jgi:hypothetical protein
MFIISRPTASAGSGGSGGGGADYRFGMINLGTTRSKYLWPFSASSPWNTPIKSGASLSAAGISFIESGTNSGGFPTRLRAESERIFMDTAAPIHTIKFNCYGWGGQSGCSETGRCNASTGATFSGTPYFGDFNVPVSSTFIVGNDGGNDSAAWIDATGNTVMQAQPYAHCTTGGDYTALVRFSDNSITGIGASGAHGGSNLSALGGTIRYGEITNALNHGLTYLSHALKVNIDAHRFYYYSHTPGWVEPAKIRDGYASAGTYGGTNPNLVPGALLTLNSSFNVAGLLTAVGRILAETIKRFGMYCVDDTTWNAVAISVEDGPAGSATTELSGLGYTLNYDPASLAGGNAFYQDMRTIFAALYIVTNNNNSNLGGGGSVMYSTPAAPAFGN